VKYVIGDVIPYILHLAVGFWIYVALFFLTSP